ncbi:hypothetical protein Q4574_00855 [Aliiglaciecola sp. 3_MG-2023]|uniref:hypothetical protein n=1 Tax=Aliiglaciecola sp. 3_MG-2023 TaxID=3062644 RepID=UPI0026E32F4D|nr:hypothetical protein [Aliiglaciecola sp. 3_MG-2023]MDO6691805.1 hypothetical protein [Aliiglaciecola sp. 3_MG-2023]
MNNLDKASIKLGKAESILMMMSAHYQTGEQELFNSDMDLIACTVGDLVSDAKQLIADIGNTDAPLIQNKPTTKTSGM